MFALKPQRRAALPALRSRQTQARPSSSSTSFSRSRCPLYREPTYLSFSDIVGTSYNRSQPVLLLILSAWKENSANFVMTEFSEVRRFLCVLEHIHSSRTGVCCVRCAASGGRVKAQDSYLPSS